jgi:hypothetical protein
VVKDPVSGEARTLNDLSRRNADLKFLVCPATTVPGTTTKAPTAPTGTSPTGTTVGHGISRVH